MTKLIEEYIAAFEERWPLPKVLALSGGKGVERDQQIMWLRTALTASFEAGKAEGKGEEETYSLEILKLFSTAVDEKDNHRRHEIWQAAAALLAPSQTTSSECCEKCGNYIGAVCNNSGCPCHSPSKS